METKQSLYNIPIVNDCNETVSILGEYSSGGYYYDILASVKYSDLSEEEQNSTLVNFINKHPNININNKKIVFDLSVYKPYKKVAFDLSDAERRSQNELIGIHECRTCKKKKTTSILRQTRSADEPGTYIFQCINPECKDQGKIKMFSEA